MAEVLLDWDVFYKNHPTPMFLVEEESRVAIDWNEACERLAGPSATPAEKFKNFFPELVSLDWSKDGNKSFYVTKPNTYTCHISFNPRSFNYQGKTCFLFTVEDNYKATKIERSLEDFYQAITQSSIVSIADKKGTITYVNENFISISGYAADELVGNNHRVINSGHHPKAFWKAMWKTITSGKIWRAEVKNKTKDGRYYWVDTFVMPFLDEKGHVREYLSIRIDITQRKEQEEEIVQLNKSLANFQIAIDTSSIVSKADKKGLITYVNRKFEEISGFGASELIGKSHSVINSKHHPKEFWTKMWKTIAKGETWRAEVMNQAKNGNYYWVDTFIMPLLDEHGHVHEYLSIRNDITQRKNQEKALEENERQLRILVQRLNLAVKASGLGVWQIDLLKGTLHGSERICELYGINHEQISMAEFWNMVHPDDREERQNQDRHYVASQTGDFYSEYRIIRPADGSIRHLKSQGIFFYNDLGQAIGGISVVYDQTKDKEYEQSLMNSIHEKEVLIKEIHHRVKNNLQLISSMFFFKVLANGESAISNDFVTGMREKIKSVSLIHERLLQTEKLDSIDIKDYLEHLLRDILLSYHNPDLALNLNTDIDHFFFTTDKATYLGQLVNELVLNVVKHAFANKKTGNILVTLKEANGKYELVVADDGIGIAENIDPMQSKSYGMQLIFVFVKQLKGELTIKREGGTRIRVEF